MTGVLIKRGCLDPETDMHSGTFSQMWLKAEVSVMYVLAEGCQLLPAHHQMLGERERSDSPLHPSEGTKTDNILISGF